MARARFFAVLAGLSCCALAYACGSDSASSAPVADAGPDDATATDGGAGDDGAATDGSSSDGGACGAAACTGVSGACGKIIDGCGQAIDCEPCRYRADPLGFQADHVAIASTGPGAWVIAIEYAGIVQLATKGAGGWQLERVAPDPEAGTLSTALFELDLAIAPDGTPWIVYANGQVVAAHRTGAGWVRESIASGYTAAIAVASDGTPFVAYAGVVPGPGGGTGAALARYAGGNWNTRSLLAASNLVRKVGVAASGAEPRVAWYDETAQAVRFAMPNGAAFAVEDVATGVSTSGVSIDLSVAVDPAGKPHVVYLPYRAGVHHAVRDPGWTGETISTIGGFWGPVRIDSTKSGGLAVAALDTIDNSLGVALHGPQWSGQTITNRCSGQRSMDIAFDPGGTLGVAHTCGATSAELWVQSGIFPSGFAAACDAISKDICTKACSCPVGTQCCVGTTCMKPGLCAGNVRDDYCGRATVDPTRVTSCQAQVPQTACAADGGINEPSDCNALRQ